MERLTAKRVNGIKVGYWTAAKKDPIVQKLGEYEDTGLEPAEIRDLAREELRASMWTDPADSLPELGQLVLIARIVEAGAPPVVEQARLMPGGVEGHVWWKIYGTNCKRILAWRPMPAAPEGIEIL